MDLHKIIRKISQNDDVYSYSTEDVLDLVPNEDTSAPGGSDETGSVKKNVLWNQDPASVRSDENSFGHEIPGRKCFEHYRIIGVQPI